MAQMHKIAYMEPPMVGTKKSHSNECRNKLAIGCVDLC
jgi:hypothetical protein